jgi:fructose/tagatose bisphosphate aldolase
LDGRQLRKIFDGFCPFGENLQLKPEDQQVTILAANSNNWWSTRAFVMAASMGKQSPIIIQFSYNSNIKIGGDPNTIWVPEGINYTANAVVNGAKANADWIAMEADAWGADYVAVSLDHFKVPGFKPGKQYKTAATPFDYAGLLEEARDFIKGRGLDRVAAEADDATMKEYLAYMTSTEYQGFRSDFMQTVSVMDPAWGMIDTDGIPFVLDFAITRDFSMGVREGLGNSHMMLEAELGATGTSGDDIAYEPMRGENLDEFANLAAAFVEYTGAEGMSYDIGMKHAAKADETHPADEHKLEVVQRTIIEQTGVYAAYAQHGGTGAAEVSRGLVGKTNINTAFLVAGSQARASHFAAAGAKVDGGDKKVCGTDVETHIYLRSLYESCLERYETTGSYQTGDRVAAFLKQ